MVTDWVKNQEWPGLKKTKEKKQPRCSFEHFLS